MLSYGKTILYESEQEARDTYDEEYIKPHKRKGCIYWDKSVKKKLGGNYVNHAIWRAEITINGKRYRKRHRDRAFLELWLDTMQ